MLFDRRRKQKQEAREYAAKQKERPKLPPRFKLETRVLPTQDGKAVEVINRRAQIKPTETAAPLPGSSTKVEAHDHDAEEIEHEYKLHGAMTYGHRTTIPKHMLLDTAVDAHTLAEMFSEEWRIGLAGAIIKLRRERHDTKAEDYCAFETEFKTCSK